MHFRVDVTAVILHLSTSELQHTSVPASLPKHIASMSTIAKSVWNGRIPLLVTANEDDAIYYGANESPAPILVTLHSQLH